MDIFKSRVLVALANNPNSDYKKAIFTPETIAALVHTMGNAHSLTYAIASNCADIISAIVQERDLLPRDQADHIRESLAAFNQITAAGYSLMFSMFSAGR